jgi:hypothetical protein
MPTDRRPKKNAKRSKKRASAVEKLRPAEGAALFRALLARHPELATEAVSMAEAMITRVSGDDVADAVEEAILALDIDALGDRAAHRTKVTAVVADLSDPKDAGTKKALARIKRALAQRGERG